MNLSETNISNEISFVLHNDENIAASSSHNRTKQKLLEHIYSGTDVILITSSQQKTGASFLQQCFDDNSDQIRTIFLNSASFPQDDLGSNNPSHDLSMISAVVYESIHLDTHFAIVMDDADKLPLQILNELIKLALAINSSKNNVNFIFAGSPELLGTVQQISEITRLGLAHCSLDEITEEDIEAYINDKQSECIESKKLKFNKYALKRITSHANGNLYKASTLLEWCRIYAAHTSNFKVTVGFIDEVFTNSECGHLLSGYPTTDFRFAASTQSSNKDENIEFSKQATEQIKSIPNADETSKTIYIDEADTTLSHKETEHNNVYEKVMAATTSDVISINGSEITSVSTSNENQPNESDTTPDSNDDEEYQDTYRIDALKDINNPLSPTYADEEMSPAAPAQLAKTPSNANNSAFLWTFFALSILFGTFYLFTTNIISYNDVRSYIGTIFSNNTAVEPTISDDSISSSLSAATDPIANLQDENSRKITALIELAESQISQKKLSTPPSDNAMETYRLILDLDPNNKEALAGIDLIKERYQTWAKLDIKDGNSKRAIYFLQRAIDISPDEEALNLLADLQ